MSANIFPREGHDYSYILNWVPIVALWLLVCSKLSIHWSANPAYKFGWFVPIFSLYALYGRWKTRPEPVENGRWCWIVVVVACLVFSPTWLFAQPNSEWSLIAWMLVGEVVAITLGSVAISGGSSWFWHFAFPICFIFAAVPFPHVVEIPATVKLMRAVAAITVELLNVCGVPAVQHGNVIEIRSGLLGVDQACSGVRSLQAALAGALYIGEIFRFGWVRRLIFVVFGTSVAIFANVVRTFSLSWLASAGGLKSIEKWHDPAGFVILSFCLVVIWFVAVLVARRDPFRGGEKMVLNGHPLPGGLVVGLFAWTASTVILVELWFHDPGGAPGSPWALVAPEGSTTVLIADEAAGQLQCDRLFASSWKNADGSDWLMYYFEWEPGSVRSRVLARVHRPDICLSSIGLKLIEDHGKLPVEAGGFSLMFHAYTFERDGHPLFVYYGIWPTRSRRAESSGELSESEHAAGVQAVLWRERNMGQQVAEFAVSGYDTKTQADASFEQALKRLLVRQLPENIRE